MLQPVEMMIGEDPKLVYKCRICGHHDKAREGDEADHCVYRSGEAETDAASGSAQSSFKFVVDRECIKDPTLSRQKDVRCRKCQHQEAVTFTIPAKDRLNLIFVCTKCTYSWRKEEGED